MGVNCVCNVTSYCFPCFVSDSTGQETENWLSCREGKMTSHTFVCPLAVQAQFSCFIILWPISGQKLKLWVPQTTEIGVSNLKFLMQQKLQATPCFKQPWAKSPSMGKKSKGKRNFVCEHTLIFIIQCFVGSQAIIIKDHCGHKHEKWFQTQGSS